MIGALIEAAVETGARRLGFAKIVLDELQSRLRLVDEL